MGVYEPNSLPAVDNGQEAVKKAVCWPVGGKSLCELALDKKKVVIVVTDISRPTPDDVIVPVVIGELKRAGVRAEDITILVATGMHRANTQEELVQKLGLDIANSIRIVNHAATDKSQLQFMGKTSFGCPVWINSCVAKADLVISTGIIEPHYFAGFSGGRKGIAIGVAGEETIRFQHQPGIFDHPNTRFGNLDGNIFHANAMEIAAMAGLSFIINAVLRDDGRIAGIAAGAPREAYYRGVELAKAIYEVRIAEQADVVVAGVGYPKDTNLYQATRGASSIAFSPFPAVRQGGLVITPALTAEGAGKGVGEQRFYEIMKEAPDINQLVSTVRARGYPAGGQRAYLLALTLGYADLIIAGSVTPKVVEDMHMSARPTMDAALKYAFERFGDKVKVIVLPHSIQLITKMQTAHGNGR